MEHMKIFLQYRQDLEQYTTRQLSYKHDPETWSIGQMLDHLIVVSHEYLDELHACIQAEKKDDSYKKTVFGEQLFQQGGFPPIKIQLPPELNAPPNNTNTREELENRLDELLSRMSASEHLLSKATAEQKTHHGGFGWLNAREWYDLIDMHARHHLRQQTELEQFIHDDGV